MSVQNAVDLFVCLFLCKESYHLRYELALIQLHWLTGRRTRTYCDMSFYGYYVPTTFKPRTNQKQGGILENQRHSLGVMFEHERWYKADGGCAKCSWPVCLSACFFIKSYHLPFERLKLLCSDYFQTEDKSEADKLWPVVGMLMVFTSKPPRSSKRLMLGMQKNKQKNY